MFKYCTRCSIIILMKYLGKLHIQCSIRLTPVLGIIPNSSSPIPPPLHNHHHRKGVQFAITEQCIGDLLRLGLRDSGELQIVVGSKCGAAVGKAFEIFDQVVKGRALNAVEYRRKGLVGIKPLILPYPDMVFEIQAVHRLSLPVRSVPPVTLF